MVKGIKKLGIIPVCSVTTLTACTYSKDMNSKDVVNQEISEKPETQTAQTVTEGSQTEKKDVEQMDEELQEQVREDKGENAVSSGNQTINQMEKFGSEELNSEQEVTNVSENEVETKQKYLETTPEKIQTYKTEQETKAVIKSKQAETQPTQPEIQQETENKNESVSEKAATDMSDSLNNCNNSDKKQGNTCFTNNSNVIIWGKLEDISDYYDMNTKGTDTSSDIETSENHSSENSVKVEDTYRNQNDSYVNEVLRLVNIERQKYGLDALSLNDNLCKVADIRANEIIVSFSHTRPNGSSCFTVLNENGISYRACGENLAYGQRTPQEVVTGWMNSTGHRENILSNRYHKIGIGVVQQSGVYYWSQMFTD